MVGDVNRNPSCLNKLVRSCPIRCFTYRKAQIAYEFNKKRIYIKFAHKMPPWNMWNAFLYDSNKTLIIKLCPPASLYPASAVALCLKFESVTLSRRNCGAALIGEDRPALCLLARGYKSGGTPPESVKLCLRARGCRAERHECCSCYEIRSAVSVYSCSGSGPLSGMELSQLWFLPFIMSLLWVSRCKFSRLVLPNSALLFTVSYSECELILVEIQG